MKLRIPFCSFLLLLAGGLFIASTTLHAESRTWTSADGRTLQAEFVGTSGAGASAVVKLKLENGNIVEYPVSKLSEQDRVFVKGNLPSDPAALAAEIDNLMITKMRESYQGLQTELAGLPEKAGMTAEEKANRKKEIDRELLMCVPNPKTSDNQFLRRIYLDVAGRIPTFDEADEFLNDRSPDKRAKLIDKLLDSDAYVMNMFNHYADLLRIREGIVMMGNNSIKADPYIEYIKDCIRTDKPYDTMVKELLTSSGKVWDSPAVNYIVADQGMRYCNLSNTFTIFMGTEITCAQCHDHPFEEVYQMDFFKMAAFMGEVESSAGNADAMSAGSGSYRDEITRMSKVMHDAGKLKGQQTQDQALSMWIGVNRINVGDSGKNAVRLPHDYKYDDGEPDMAIEPATYFGDKMDVSKYSSSREAFADWMISPSNPRFTVNLVNRLWKLAFGLAQVEPVYNLPGHLNAQAQNYALLTYLEEMMKDLKFSVRDFMRVVYNTEAYQREAETFTPSLTQLDQAAYHFPGPLLRRMSAEQVWDSLVALTTADPESVTRQGAAEYKKVMDVDYSTLKTAEDIENWKKQWQGVSKLVKKDGSVVSRDENVGGEQMFRASELRQPMPATHFLRMFGQSDRLLIENQFTTGSSPQVMALLNGEITNKVLTSPDAYLIKEIAFGKGSKRDNIDKIFLSVLTRYPSSEEKTMAQSGMRARTDRSMSDQQKLEVEAQAIGNVIWALVNTREFMFIQ